jgi:LacI family transcriptional regulator
MTLGLILPDGSNPFFAALSLQLENAAFAKGYTLLFGNTMDDDRREEVYVRSLVDRQVDGLLLIPSHGARAWEADLSRSDIPSVILDRDISLEGMSVFLADNAGGGYAATQHLIEHGHRRVGCIAGPLDEQPTKGRVAGWRAALTGAELEASLPLLRDAPFGRGPAFLAAREILSLPDRPTALFVTSDEQAAGVIRAASELGISVPQELAICSFDGSVASAFTVPSLTTIRQPIGEIAVAAIDHLIARIHDPKLPAVREIFDVEIIRRRSCGCDDVSAVPSEEAGA